MTKYMSPSPAAGKDPAALVLRAWWGLNQTTKVFCTQLSESGFVAFVPDLHDGKVADNIADAEIPGKALDTNHGMDAERIASGVAT